MDTATIIISLVFFGAFAVPLIILGVRRKAKEKKFLNVLFQFAESNGGKIGEFDFWKDTSIGIDRDLRMLFFVRKKGGEDQKTAIKLSEIQQCKLNNISRASHAHNVNGKVVDRLELVFKYNTPGVPDTVLEFYNSSTDSLTLVNELQLIEKWNKIVTGSLGSPAVKKAG